MTELERIRMEKRMTRRALAEKAGLAYATVYQIETGLRSIGDEALFKLADALDVEPLELRPRAVA